MQENERFYSERRLPPLMRRCWYSLNQAFRRRIAHLNITPNHYTILRWLSEYPDGLTQREIATLMASDANTITAILTRMEQQKLIARHPHRSDGRARLITLEPNGKDLLAQAHPLAVKLQEEILSALPEEIRDEFLENLSTIAMAAQHTLDAHPSDDTSSAA